MILVAAYSFKTSILLLTPVPELDLFGWGEPLSLAVVIKLHHFNS